MCVLVVFGACHLALILFRFSQAVAGVLTRQCDDVLENSSGSPASRNISMSSLRLQDDEGLASPHRYSPSSGGFGSSHDDAADCGDEVGLIVGQDQQQDASKADRMSAEFMLRIGWFVR